MRRWLRALFAKCFSPRPLPSAKTLNYVTIWSRKWKLLMIHLLLMLFLLEDPSGSLRRE